MNKNWLSKQILSNTEQWDESLTTYYPNSSSWMSDPISYLNQLTVNCNYLRAIELINWDKYLTENTIVLDIGCGGGWLSGFLSKKTKVKKIFSIDSSRNYLNNFLPTVVSQMNGDQSKIETVQGLFTPILFEADTVDLIVISSAIHHADSISNVLKECKRVLKPNGYVLILNETPSNNIKYLVNLVRKFSKIFYQSITKKYSPFVQKISSGGILYDPYLGDIDYPNWYWEKSINDSELFLESIIDSRLTTVNGLEGRFLNHFICKKL